jgi:hypothetical protein
MAPSAQNLAFGDFGKTTFKPPTPYFVIRLRSRVYVVKFKLVI